MKFNIFCLTFLITFLFVSCKKQTTISGKITSSAGGAPIEGVDVSLEFYFTGDGNVTKIVGSDQQQTDIKGQYMLEVKSKHRGSGSLSVHKEGFAPVNVVLVQSGDNKEMNFVLNPFDAWLSITFENKSPTEDKKYYYDCRSDFLIQGFSKDSGGPFILHPLESKTDLHLIPGGSPIKLTWDTIRKSGQPLKNLEIIPCNRNVTTFYTVQVQ